MSRDAGALSATRASRDGLHQESADAQELGDDAGLRILVLLECGHWFHEHRAVTSAAPVPGEMRTCRSREHYPAQFPATYVDIDYGLWNLIPRGTDDPWRCDRHGVIVGARCERCVRGHALMRGYG